MSIKHCLLFSFLLYQKQMAAAQSLHRLFLLVSEDQQLDRDHARKQKSEW